MDRHCEKRSSSTSDPVESPATAPDHNATARQFRRRLSATERILETLRRWKREKLRRGAILTNLREIQENDLGPWGQNP